MSERNTTDPFHVTRVEGEGTLRPVPTGKHIGKMNARDRTRANTRSLRLRTGAPRVRLEDSGAVIEVAGAERVLQRAAVPRVLELGARHQGLGSLEACATSRHVSRQVESAHARRLTERGARLLAVRDGDTWVALGGGTALDDLGSRRQGARRDTERLRVHVVQATVRPWHRACRMFTFPDESAFPAVRADPVRVGRVVLAPA